MKVTPDTRQAVKASLKGTVECAKVLMGTLLVFTVPHPCGNHDCTASELAARDDAITRAAMVLNFLAVAAWMVVYGVESSRERWCVRYLDIDEDKPLRNLDTEIEAFPRLKAQMKQRNTHYHDAVAACAAIQVVNIACSCAELAMHGKGAGSAVPLVNGVLLLSTKLSTARTASVRSLQEERALSAYLTAPRTYNTIDSDYVKPPAALQKLKAARRAYPGAEAEV